MTNILKNNLNLFSIGIKNVQNSFKNLLGSVVYYFCQWITLIIIIHIAGYTVSGEYSLVISFTNLFALISSFGIRSFQLSDSNNYYTPQQYTGAYVITCILSTIIFLISLPFTGYDIKILICCLANMLYKLFETFSSYVITYMQLEDKYSNILFSYCIKGIFPLITFSIFLFYTQNLSLSLLFMSLTYIIIIILYDLKKLNTKFLQCSISKETNNILKYCFPITLSSLILPFMLYFSRHTIKLIYGITVLGYYSVFTMIISILSVLIGSINIVLLPKISEKYLKKQTKGIIYIISIMLGIIFIFAMISIFIANSIGKWVFTVIFGLEILPYMYLLLPIIFSGIALTIMSFFSTCLIAIHRIRDMLICMLSGVSLLIIFIFPATKTYGLLGTTYLFIISLAVMIFLQFFIVFNCLFWKVSNDI